MAFWRHLWRFPRKWQANDQSFEEGGEYDEAEHVAYPWEGYCVAPRCFDSPQRQKLQPLEKAGNPVRSPVKVYRLPMHHTVPGMDFRWKAGLKLHHAAGSDCWKSQLTACKAFAFPHCLGLNDDGHWRWPSIPVSFLVGVKGEAAWPRARCNWCPSAKIQIFSPVGGLLGLRPTLKVLPEPKLVVKRDFQVAAQSFVSIGLTLKGMQKRWYTPCPSIQIGWNQGSWASIQTKLQQRKVELHCRGAAQSCWDTTLTFGALAGPHRPSISTWVVDRGLHQRPSLQYLKLTKLVGKREPRISPAPTWRYVDAQRQLSKKNKVVLVPGHFIDPEGDTGAPGERDFNQLVAGKAAARLSRTGWHVLRPDRDAPHLMWEEYINWVSKQTLRGVPVLEIHGQGPEAIEEGAVWGVIGDTRMPLNKRLAEEFGWYCTDWKELAVPRRGGVIVEGFNSDEVLGMNHERRELAAERLAWRLWQCIEDVAEVHLAQPGGNLEGGNTGIDAG